MESLPDSVPNLRRPASMDSSSLESLSLSFGNLGLSTNASAGSSSLGSSSAASLPCINGFPTRTTQETAAVSVLQNSETGFRTSMLEPPLLPFYSQSVWPEPDNLSYGRRNLACSSLPSSWNGSGLLWQPSSLNHMTGIGDNLPSNYGFPAPYKSNLAVHQGGIGCQENSFGGFASQSSHLGYPSAAIRTNGNLLFNGLNNNSTRNLWNQESLHRLPQDNKFLMFAMTQSGSLKLQSLLSMGDSSITEKIFKGVIDFIFHLMSNCHGHHVFGKLIRYCNEDQLNMIARMIGLQFEEFFNASLDRYGSPSIQRLIKVLNQSGSPMISEVVKALCKGFYGIMTNRTGSNVILKCLEILNVQKNKPLYEAAVDNCLQLATHEQGCISLNKLITNIKGSFRYKILGLISDNAVYLSQDPSGNFVVQHVLELHHPFITKKICSLLRGHYVKISMQKGGSHVVEKCLNTSEMEIAVLDLLQSNQLLQVAKDQYGNYVIQAALRATRLLGSPLHESLLTNLQPHLVALGHHGYGKNILSLIQSAASSSTSTTVSE